VAIITVVAPLLAPAADAEPRAPTTGQPVLDGGRVESHSMYTLDPAARAVHVRVDVTVTNQMPNVRQGNSILESYLSGFNEPVPAETANISATGDDGRNLDVSTDPTDDPIFETADIKLSPALFYPNSESFTLTYDLPAQPPRSPNLTRVNDAFSTFIAYGFGDPGITSVKVVVPQGLDVDVAGVDMQRSTENGETVLTADAIDDPANWTAGISARDDERLAKRDASVAHQNIAVLAWPDDDQWSTFVTGEVQKGLPELEKLIDLPWPRGAHDVEIIETATPYLYGYAGWYEPYTGKIEIGDDLDAHVVLHELSHVWFNKTLFEDRWISEGFADEFAAQTLQEVGEQLPSPTSVTPGAPGTVSLEDWGTPDFQNVASTDEEDFGYNASWTLMRALSTEVGMDRLADVVHAAANHTIAYRGDRKPEVTGTTVGWKQLLDLLDEVAGSKQADDLFQTYVVSAKDQPLLADRQTARQGYQALVAQGEGWSAPYAVRLPMSKWDFTSAVQFMGTARHVLDTRSQIVDTLRPLNIGAPRGLRQEYETGRNLNRISQSADLDLRAAHSIVDANSAVHAAHGPIGAIGMRLDGAKDQLREAKDALDRGDGAAAIAAANRATKSAHEATATGIKLLVALALLAGLLGAALIWLRPALARRVRHEPS
jgi:hypothetical protein